jgi:hypothetical protein
MCPGTRGSRLASEWPATNRVSGLVALTANPVDSVGAIRVAASCERYHRGSREASWTVACSIRSAEWEDSGILRWATDPSA